jgi:hypothetical protein
MYPCLPPLSSGCLYTSPYQEMEFLANHLYPTVHPVYPQLNFLFWDHNKDHMVAYANAFYNNATLKAMVWGIALHWYSGDGFSNVQQVYDAWPGKGIMATEACDCPINLDRPACCVPSSLFSPDHIGGESCDAPVIRLMNNTLHYQPAYYYLGHFSRFLPRNAVRIMHQFTDSDSTLEITTWLVHVGTGSPDSGLKESVKRRTQQTGQAPSGNEVVVVVLNRESDAWSTCRRIPFRLCTLTPRCSTSPHRPQSSDKGRLQDAKLDRCSETVCLGSRMISQRSND